MFDQDYSKKVWIIGIVMAIGCLLMDVYILLSDNAIMRDAIWMTMPLSAFILYKCIQGLKKKIDEEKNG